MSRFSIKGYAEQRITSYSEAGTFGYFEMPGGAALLARLLHKIGFSEDAYLNVNHRKQHVHAEIVTRVNSENEQVTEILESVLGIENGVSCLCIDTNSDNGIQWGSDYLDTEALRRKHVLWLCGLDAPDPKLPSESALLLASNCFLVIDASLLRKKGALISKQVSWERTSMELIWHLTHNPDLKYLLQVERILITFAEDGAVYLRCNSGEIVSASLALTHGNAEEYLRENYKRNTSFAFTVMVAAVAKQFEAVMSDAKKPDMQAILRPVKNLMKKGYSLDEMKSCELFDDSCERPESELTFEIQLPVASPIDPDNWCIAANVKGKLIFDIAYEYVKKGISAIGTLPRLKIGDLMTIDRWEIEAYQNIRNSILNYAKDDNGKPLCIAVFGAPGAGKSYGVKQIATNTLPEGKVKVLEYNVSAFTDIHDLNAAFHDIRETRLSGKIPLVFFDEFDSAKDGIEYGWIKSFLMPMQDGKYRDKNVENQLGQCILIFSGGTVQSHEDFIGPLSLEKEDDHSRKFKNAKCPDFISRLKGTLDVVGPNRIGNDKNYILRRALLLRSFSMRKNCDIDDNVLRAMLLAPKYKHGVRSMESILDMSRLEGNIWKPASLPFKSQLSLHVDADAFIKLVLRETILNSYIEKLAERIHEVYRRQQIESDSKNAPSAVPWKELSKKARDSNRKQAEDIKNKLRKIDCDYDCGDTPYIPIQTFTESEIELLAQEEHIRWMDEKYAEGMTCGPRDDKHHPSLKEWKDLSDDEKEKDREAVRNIISLLNGIRLHVYRIE